MSLPSCSTGQMARGTTALMICLQIQCCAFKPLLARDMCLSSPVGVHVATESGIDCIARPKDLHSSFFQHRPWRWRASSTCCAIALPLLAAGTLLVRVEWYEL